MFTEIEKRAFIAALTAIAYGEDSYPPGPAIAINLDAQEEFSIPSEYINQRMKPFQALSVLTEMNIEKRKVVLMWLKKMANIEEEGFRHRLFSNMSDIIGKDITPK